MDLTQRAIVEPQLTHDEEHLYPVTHTVDPPHPMPPHCAPPSTLVPPTGVVGIGVAGALASLVARSAAILSHSALVPQETILRSACKRGARGEGE